MRSRRFQVAGHTDNIPVATAQFKSNWELSSARAVNVTGALIRGGLRPEQLVAAGYGEYDPVARNTKEAGRAKNRRIEIILEPRLREFPELEKAAAKKSDKGEEKLAVNDKPAAKRSKKP
jgi:chemotaxis protein MotB